MSNISELSPSGLWKIFKDFTDTPRPSKCEEQIINYLVEFSKKHNLEYVLDEVKNVIIYVPATIGRESEDAIIIQNHIDMVTDKLPEVEIDFYKDGIQTYIDGDWVKARGTTLGADNGIGCAAALALALEKDLSHPRLELVFTVDEETGLNGALGLESKYLTGKKMLNLDTEEWGTLYNGCAGGIDHEFNGSFETQELKETTYKFSVKGFQGGHSGVEIHEQRANAIKFLAKVLTSCLDSSEFRVVEVQAGRAHNIIPREAFAIIETESSNIDAFKKIAEDISNRWKSFLPESDKEFSFLFEEVEFNKPALTDKSTSDFLSLLELFPHGAHSYELTQRSLVSLSNNLAKVLLMEGKLYILNSSRFFDSQQIVELNDKYKQLSKVFKLEMSELSSYPSWKPVSENKLMDHVKAVYEDIYKKPAEVTAIHAGLECGIIRDRLKDKLGDLDAVSFGPTIMGAHGPDERVQISTVESFWNLLLEVIRRL